MFVGRFEFNKGLTVLLEAMARLLKHRPHLGKSVQLLVVGGQNPDQCIEPREQRELKRLVGVLGLDRHVKFLGPLSHPELARYFAAAEVTVVPSYYETFGLVALEAIACGSPVIASDVGGLSYTVSDGETGLLVPPGDIEALERALARILENGVLLNHMRMRASQGLSSSFTWPEIARQLGKMYTSANLGEEASAYESRAALVACQ
jgi:glycosyltransferase involved in cell wall biosynthesis